MMKTRYANFDASIAKLNDIDYDMEKMNVISSFSLMLNDHYSNLFQKRYLISQCKDILKRYDIYNISTL